MRSSYWSATVLVALLAAGCGGSGAKSPTDPGPLNSPAATSSARSRTTAVSNRQLYGIWEVRVAADHQSAEFVPLRIGRMHLNATRLLEKQPFSDCLKIGNFVVHSPNEISADLTLWHPFPGNFNLCGFDMRGIFISNADYVFPTSGRTIALGDGLPRLLNADGYTSLFNPNEFPETEYGPPALKYFAGKCATGGDLSATLNPFVAYARGVPRRMFGPGGVETRTVRLAVPDGPFEFGYAVDVCWAPVPGGVSDPLNDFPPEANCQEAYKLGIEIGPGLKPEAGAWADVCVEVWDHQGLDTISKVTVEAPQLFVGELDLSYSTSVNDESYLFAGTIANELGAGKGHYPLLVRVVDAVTDVNLGAVDAWLWRDVRIKTGWAVTWGGTGKDWGLDCIADDSGNTYVTGYFGGTADFDPGPGIEERSGLLGRIYLAKFDPSGRLIWVRNWGGAGEYSSSGRAIASDSYGNIYVTGTYKGPADFDPGPGEDIRTLSGSFLSKFDADGNLHWACTWGEETAEYNRNSSVDVALDSSGSAYLTGTFHGTVDFDPGPGTDEHTTSTYYDDIFLVKLDADGGFQWARTWGGDDEDGGNGVAANGSGDVYVTGYFRCTVDFDPGPGREDHTSNYGHDIFLSKFDSSGNFQWARAWGGAGAHEEGSTVAVSDSGGVFVTGHFWDTVDFDPGPGTEEHCSNGGEDVFLSQFDPSGEFQWVVTWGGRSGEEVNSVALDDSGGVFVTGYFGGTVDFDPGPGVEEHATNGKEEVFLSKLDAAGAFCWARTWGGAGRDYGTGVALGGDGNIYVTGGFIGIVDFDPGPNSDFHTNHAQKDAFLSMFLPDGNW